MQEHLNPSFWQYPEQEPEEILYICGCREQYCNSEQFREHVITAHDGHFLENSSHYLSRMLGIVVPCNPTFIVKTIPYQPKQQTSEKQDQANMAKIRRQAAQNEKSINRKRRNKTVEEHKKEKAKNKKKNADTEQGLQQLSTQVVAGRQEQKEKKRNRSRGRSGPRRKRGGRRQPKYVRGQSAQSHSADDRDDDEKGLIKGTATGGPSAGWDPLALERRQEKKRLPVMECVSGGGSGVIHCFRLSSRRKVNIVCGCGNGKKYNFTWMTRHIREQHNDLLPQGSNHIIGRTSSNYVFVIPVQGNDSLQYCCPCSFSIVRSKADFIRHTFERHFGVTPLYKKQ